MAQSENSFTFFYKFFFNANFLNLRSKRIVKIGLVFLFIFSSKFISKFDKICNVDCV